MSIRMKEVNDDYKTYIELDDILKKNIKNMHLKKKTDLSYLVAGLFKKILDESKDEKSEITPLVKELIGVIPKKYSNKEIDNMYKKHLEEKYL